MRLLAALTSLIMGLAQPVQSRTLAQDLGPALWSGDARLGLYALRRQSDPRLAPVARALVAGSPQVRFRLVAGLAWDDTINGGVAAERVKIFGLAR